MRVGEDQRPHGPIQRGRLTDMELSVRRIGKNGLYSRSVIDRESGTRCDPPGRISSKMRITNVDTERVGEYTDTGLERACSTSSIFCRFL